MSSGTLVSSSITPPISTRRNFTSPLDDGSVWVMTTSSRSTSSELVVEYVTFVACARALAPVSITAIAPATTSNRLITAPHRASWIGKLVGKRGEQGAFQRRKSLRVALLRYAVSRGGRADVNIIDGHRRACDVSNFLTVRRHAAATRS